MPTCGLRTIILSCALLFAAASQCVADDVMRAGAQTWTARRTAINRQLTLPNDASPEARRRWSALLAAHGVSVLADLVTTRRALARGASERNPLLDWGGNERALTLRAYAGVGLTFSLQHLHKDHPRLARRIAWAAIFLNVAVAAHNYQQAR